jgi:hypothetical protein
MPSVLPEIDENTAQKENEKEMRKERLNHRSADSSPSRHSAISEPLQNNMYCNLSLPLNGPFARHYRCDSQASARGQSGDREQSKVIPFSEPGRNHKLSGQHLERRRTGEEEGKAFI